MICRRSQAEGNSRPRPRVRRLWSSKPTRRNSRLPQVTQVYSFSIQFLADQIDFRICQAAAANYHNPAVSRHFGVQDIGPKELAEPLLLGLRPGWSLAEGKPQPDHLVQIKMPGGGRGKISGKTFLPIEAPFGKESGPGLVGDRQGKHVRATLPQGRQDGLQFLVPLQSEAKSLVPELRFWPFSGAGL